MQKPKKVGIALSSRESAQLVFEACQKVFQRQRIATVVQKKLDAQDVRQNKEFLESDIVICFGGDGSFLRMAQAIQKPIPVFLVGTGERNYLSTIPAEDAPKKIEEILRGKYRIEKRNRLASNLPDSPLALNEIAVVPQASATLMHYELFIEKKMVWHDYSDGVLVSTPTGSKAYFHAAGGPEIEQNAPVLGAMPLNSIDGKKGFVFSQEKKARIDKINCLTPVEAVFDGQQRRLVSKEIMIGLTNKPLSIGFPLQPAFKQKTKEGLTPSARFVLSLLQGKGACTQQELVVQSGLHARSIQRALHQLLAEKKITKRPYSKDKRQDLFHPL